MEAGIPGACPGVRPGQPGLSVSWQLPGPRPGQMPGFQC